MIRAAFFESSERRYTLMLTVDLLGDITVERSWGGKHNKRHGKAPAKFFETVEAANGYFEQQIKRRRRRGYHIHYHVDDIKNPRSKQYAYELQPQPVFDPATDWDKPEV